MDRPAIIDPPIPYVGAISTGCFTPGRLIRIQGNTPGVAYRFDFNLQCGPETLPRDDIAMQVSVHILDGFITINSFQNGIWGEEQQGSHQPVKRAEKFEMILMCDVNRYKVAVNGQHFADFPQRIHYDCITHLTIEGDVSIVQISYESVSTNIAPAPSPTPVLLRQTDDDFEIINTYKPKDIGFVQPPSYSEVAHGGNPYSGLPPYPVHDVQGVPKHNAPPYPTGVPGTFGMPYPPTGVVDTPGAISIHTPPSDVPVPLNAAASNIRPVQKTNTKKCCGYFLSIIFGIIIIIAVIISKVDRNKSYNHKDNYYRDNYGTKDNDYHY